MLGVTPPFLRRPGVEGKFLTPVVGDRIGLHRLGDRRLLAGGALFGFLGDMLAVPSPPPSA
jgi:hypothetical protein